MYGVKDLTSSHGPSEKALGVATLVYFAAIVTGISGVSAATASATLFVAGVATASLAWQALLVLLGAFVRTGAGGRFRRATAIIGNSLVGCFGILKIFGLIY